MCASHGHGAILNEIARAARPARQGWSMQPPTLTDDAHPDAITLRPHTARGRRRVPGDVQRPGRCSAGPRCRCPTSAEHAERVHRRSGRRVGGRRRLHPGDRGDRTTTACRRFAGNISLRPERHRRRRPRLRPGAVGARARRDVAGGAAGAGLGLSRPVASGGARPGGRALAGARRQLGLPTGRLGVRVPGRGHGARPVRPARHPARRLDRLDRARATRWSRRRRGWRSPTLEGEQVRLRPWRADDAPRVARGLRGRAHPALAARSCPSPYTLADAQWYVGSREERHASGTGFVLVRRGRRRATSAWARSA